MIDSTKKITQTVWIVYKRVFDLLIAIILCAAIIWWLVPVIVIMQKLLNPGPIFFNTGRTGRNGREFVCHKFRSMIADAVNDASGECRVTRFGYFLRKTNLDELPQFFNVIKGDMSIVGPRPHDVEENTVLSSKIGSYELRHTVRPGITGWAQVNGYHGTTPDIDKMRKRTEYDLWYIENWSMSLDMKIVYSTALGMVTSIVTQLFGSNSRNVRSI